MVVLYHQYFLQGYYVFSVSQVLIAKLSHSFVYDFPKLEIAEATPATLMDSHTELETQSFHNEINNRLTVNNLNNKIKLFKQKFKEYNKLNHTDKRSRTFIKMFHTYLEQLKRSHLRKKRHITKMYIDRIIERIYAENDAENISKIIDQHLIIQDTNKNDNDLDLIKCFDNRLKNFQKYYKL